MRRLFLVLVCMVVSACAVPSVTTVAPLVKVDSRPPGYVKGEPFVRGTGFFVSSDGYFVTAAHVVDDLGDYYVYLSDSPRIERRAYLVAVDWAADIALLHVVGVRSRPLRFCPVVESLQEIYTYSWREELPERTAGVVLLAGSEGRWTTDNLVTYGFSGGPAYDEKQKCVAGVLSMAGGFVLNPRAIIVWPGVSERVMGFLRKYAPKSVVGF